MPRVGFLVNTVSRRATARADAVRWLSEELGCLGYDVVVVSGKDCWTEADLPEWQRVKVAWVRGSCDLLAGFSFGWIRKLRELRPDVVHLMGIWQYHNWVAYRWCKGVGAPLVVSACGMCGKEAMRHRSWKKLPAWWLFQRRVLTSAAVLHATSENELQSLRRLGLTAPVAVVPLGVPLPVRSTGPKERIVLYLGRLHPVKNLEILVLAWAQQVRPGWKLVVAGQEDYPGYRRRLARLAVDCGLDEGFELREAVYGAEKWALLASSELFVLPSFAENFGLVVAEALASGTPVIAGRGTPWQILQERGCGWWVDATVQGIGSALAAALELSSAERRAMGERGRQLVGEYFSWPNVARRMKAVYDWVLNQGAEPDCVFH